MAKNCNVLSIRSNVIEENRKILNELRNQHQVHSKNEVNLNQLFERLNSKNSSRKIGNGDASFTWHTKQDVNYTYGPIEGFPPGSWWGILMDCARDRVHDSFDSDVQIGPTGATSICTSQMNTKDDIDLGDFLTITGERFSEAASKEDPLIHNYKNQIPIRLIRSYNLSNQFAPKTGYRYDGLYVIIAYWIGISSNNVKHNKFALMRLSGQESAPWHHSLNSTLKSPVSGSLRPSLKPNGHYLHSASFEKGQSRSGKDAKVNNALSFTVPEQTKNTYDSVIVKRQTFTKSHNELDNVNAKNSTLLSSDLPTHFNVHGSKAQSTNISIRTDLYDSSRNFQPDVKKASLIFYKSCTNTTPKRVVQHTDSSSLLQCNKGNKINVKIEPSKNNTKSELTNRSTSEENVQSTSTNNTGFSANIPNNDAETKNADKKKTCSSQSYTVRFSKRIRREESNSPNDNVQSKLPNQALDDRENLIQSMDIDSYDGRSFESLESLTPDEILKLINRETRHPLSQFLIDSMIGLGPEESLKFRSCVSLQSQNDTQNTVAMTNNRVAEKNVKSTSHKCSVNERNCKFIRHKNRPVLCTEITNQSRVQTYRKMLRNRAAKNINFSETKQKSSTDKKSTMKLRSKQMYKRHSLSGTLSKNNEKNKTHDSGTTRMSTATTELSLSDKPNSKYNVKREIQKKSSTSAHPTKRTRQRREITNLLVDAKLIPLARSPRNRRLRCINTIYSKKRSCDSSFKSLFCNVEKRKIGIKKSKRQSEFRKQSNLNEYLDRLNRVRRKQTPNYVNIIQQNKRDINLNSMEKAGMKLVKTSANKNSKEDTNRSVSKKKLSCASKWKHLCCLHDKEQLAKPPAADAMVQCSFPTELSTNNSWTRDTRMSADRKGDRENTVKIERACNSTEVESDSPNDRRQVKHRRKSDFNTETENQDHHASLVQTISAFVPVDTFNSDLRIARLRSLGFKPIKSNSINEQASNSSENANVIVDDEENESSARKVIDRDAQEEYNKYTNEESSLVGYMDEELSYQDIEEEDTGKRVVSVPVGNERTVSAGEKSWNETSMEHDLELPWHGWRKVITKEQSFWVGW